MTAPIDNPHVPALDEFAGLWTLERRIEDRRSGRPGAFAGRAEFRAGEGGLVVEEEGELAIEGQAPLRATRRYLWRAAPDGGIEVRFADGRAFHGFVPGRTEMAEHICAPDLYRVAYDFRAWPRWSAVWTVTGPRKDYTMVSHYARLG